MRNKALATSAKYKSPIPYSAPLKNREADPLAKEGEPTTRTSKNLVTGGTNTVAKKALVGAQHTLPQHVQDGIKAAPGKMYDAE